MSGIFFSGVFDLPWWGYVAVTLGLTHVTIASVTIFLHRHQAHRALDLHPAASHFFRFWLWLTTGMVTREWAAIHRKHHAKCDTPEDPHSPQVLGINRVLWGGVFLYVREAHNHETIERYGRGTPDDWIERNFYSRFAALGLTLMGAIDILLFGAVPGLLIVATQIVWIPFWAAGVINGIGHYWGYRNWSSPGASSSAERNCTTTTMLSRLRPSCRSNGTNSTSAGVISAALRCSGWRRSSISHPGHISPSQSR
jgi:stearoyl-CoA desaturase (Delta-9 desaturase)